MSPWLAKNQERPGGTGVSPISANMRLLVILRRVLNQEIIKDGKVAIYGRI